MRRQRNPKTLLQLLVIMIFWASLVIVVCRDRLQGPCNNELVQRVQKIDGWMDFSGHFFKYLSFCGGLSSKSNTEVSLCQRISKCEAALPEGSKQFQGRLSE